MRLGPDPRIHAAAWFSGFWASVYLYSFNRFWKETNVTESCNPAFQP